jgi:hypothetical protein
MNLHTVNCCDPLHHALKVHYRTYLNLPYVSRGVFLSNSYRKIHLHKTLDRPRKHNMCLSHAQSHLRQYLTIMDLIERWKHLKYVQLPYPTRIKVVSPDTPSPPDVTLPSYTDSLMPSIGFELSKSINLGLLSVHSRCPYHHPRNTMFDLINHVKNHS